MMAFRAASSRIRADSIKQAAAGGVRTAARVGVSVGASACVIWAAHELNEARLHQARVQRVYATTRLYETQTEPSIRYALALNSILFPLSCCSFALIASKLGLKREQLVKRGLGRSMLMVPAGWLAYAAINLYVSDRDPEIVSQTSDPISLLEHTTHANRTVHGESAGTGMLADSMTTGSFNVAEMCFFAVIAAPIGEEMFFRYFMLATLATSMHPLLACCLSSAAFGAVHSSSVESEVKHVPWRETLLGMALGGAYLASGRIAVPILMHALNNGLAVYAMRAANIIGTDSAVTVNDKGDLSILFTLYVIHQACISVNASLSRIVLAFGGTERDGIFKVNPMVDRCFLTKIDPSPLTGTDAAPSVALPMEPFKGLRTGQMTEGMKQLIQDAYSAQLGTSSGSSWSYGAECFFEYRLVTLCTVLKHVAMSEPGWKDMKVHELLSALFETNSTSKFETLVHKFTPAEARRHDIARRCCLSEMIPLHRLRNPQIESLFTAPGEAWYTSNATNRFLRRNESFELTEEQFVSQMEDGVAINDSEVLVRMFLCHLINMNKNPLLFKQSSLDGSLLEALRDFQQQCEDIDVDTPDSDHGRPHELPSVTRVAIPYMCESRADGYQVASINMSQLKVHIK